MTAHPPIPEIEFHAGKRPGEMTTDELLVAIEFVRWDVGDSTSSRWRKRLCDEFDRRRTQIAGTGRFLSLIDWLLSDARGASSEAIFAHMVGVPPRRTVAEQYPRDVHDRGRCVRLLDKFPEWIARLDELSVLGPMWELEVPKLKKAVQAWRGDGSRRRRDRP